eukprot:s2154_g16.t1
METWLVKWLRSGKAEARSIAQRLVRLCFASIALDWERPFLGPLHAWSSAVQGKAEASRAWIGGFLELVDGCQGPWFSLEVEKSWAPWAFAKGDPNKVIAALELLATLVGVRLWVPDGDAKKTSRVAIRGYTDNQSNEALLKKAMTTKFPPTLILMELAGELSAKNCELQLQWVRRDLNRLADDLTNENFASLGPNFRIALKGEALEWRVLGRLLSNATSYFEELGELKKESREAQVELSRTLFELRQFMILTYRCIPSNATVTTKNKVQKVGEKVSTRVQPLLTPLLNYPYERVPMVIEEQKEGWALPGEVLEQKPETTLKPGMKPHASRAIRN